MKSMKLTWRQKVYAGLLILVCINVTTLLLNAFTTQIDIENGIVTNIATHSEALMALKSYDSITTTCVNQPDLRETKSSSLSSPVSCASLFHGDVTAVTKAQEYMRRHRKILVKYEEFHRMTSNCATLRKRYLTCPLSEEEREFPIAYSILCHKDAEQVERLLRSIYQPQNVYCFHPDEKADPEFHRIIENIASCFNNVFIVSKLERVVYASYKRLDAELNCVYDLLQRPEKWKYYINLAGQVFPLKTNREIVQILKLYNGANDIEGLKHEDFIQSRVQHVYRIKKFNKMERLVQTHSRFNVKVPSNLTLVRGSAYGVFSREFLRYVATNEIANELLQWSRDTRTPDEHFWATLNHLYYNPFLKSPGGYWGKPNEKPWLASYSAWQNDSPCHGKFVHYVCIFGVKDLPTLIERKELFANKFYINYEYLTLDCLEEYIYNRTMHKPYFNLTYYENLPFINRS